MIKNKPLVSKAVAYGKGLYEKTIETNAELKEQFFQFLPFIIASVITGFIAFLYSRIFTYAEKLSIYVYDQNKLFIFILTPISFLTSWWLVRRFAPYAKGSGIPQVMASISLAKPETKKYIKLFLSFKIIIIKVLASSIKVVGGGILGREGPTIQISSSIFNMIYKYLPKWWTPISQQNILIAGAASGLAAAFNTPLGGIIFAIEELSKFHIKHYKSPLFIAVIIAGLTAQGFGGAYLYLGYPKTGFHGWSVILGVVITAVIAGYFGSKMCDVLLKFIVYINSLRQKAKQIGIVVLCALLVATTIYFFGTETMGSGKELMVRTLFTDDKTVPWYLPFLRMSGLILSFGFGGAGGVFAPSLSSGASLGALIAEFMNLTGPNANLIILIGMVSFLTGVTRAPFTSAIIIFEMTDRHSVIFYLLLGAILSNIIANIVSKKSFYDHLKEMYIDDVNRIITNKT